MRSERLEKEAQREGKRGRREERKRGAYTEVKQVTGRVVYLFWLFVFCLRDLPKELRIRN